MGKNFFNIKKIDIEADLKLILVAKKVVVNLITNCVNEACLKVFDRIIKEPNVWIKDYQNL